MKILIKKLIIHTLFILVFVFISKPNEVYGAETINTFLSKIEIESKTTYKRDELPEILINSESSLLQRIFKSISGKRQVIEIKDPQDNTVFKKEIENEEEKIMLTEDVFKAGKYNLYIDGKNAMDFSWGVLAINTNKSVYQTGETSQISIAVLNENGVMVCDADVQIDIIDPSGKITHLSTSQDSITINPECHLKEVTNNPDYQTSYTTSIQGKYTIHLTAATMNGTYQVEDNFLVDTNQIFDIERLSATRIFPQHKYPMRILLTSKYDFSGNIIETIPNNFDVSNLENSLEFNLKSDRDSKFMIWDVVIKAGETLSIGYIYDAPDVSPEFYLIGPLQIEQSGDIRYKEYRKWQIASDSIAFEEVKNGTIESGSITSVTTSATLTAANDQLYLASISTKPRATPTSVTGLGLTWNLIHVQCSDRNQTEIRVYKAIGTPSGDDTVSASFTSFSGGAAISVSRYSGVNSASPTGNIEYANSGGVGGSAGACDATGTDTNSYSFSTLDTQTDGAIVYSAAAQRLMTHTAGSGYDERADIKSGSSGDSAGIATQDKTFATATTDLTVNGSFSGNVDWAVIAVEITPFINSSPTTPSLDSPSDTATNQSLTPALLSTGTDTDSDYLRYKIELCENVGMSTNCQTFDQTSSQTGWSGQDAQTSTAYASGTQATYTIQSALSPATTYYWRSYAIDPGGSNTWSSTQGTPYSFTTTTAPSTPSTPYAEGQTNPTSIIDLTPEFSAVYSDPNSDDGAYYEIEVNTQNDFLGTSMWDTGQTSMSALTSGNRSTDVSYAGTALNYNGTTYYWRIRFWDNKGAVSNWTSAQSFSTNSLSTTPSLDSPTDTATNQSLTPALKTTTTDSDSDYLRYKIELCENVGMSTNCQTFDQTSSQTGWSGQDAQTSTAYASGTQATYTIQSALSPATTYYWRSYAIDPGGSNTWSSTQGTPYSFTTLSGNNDFKFKGLNLKGINLQ